MMQMGMARLSITMCLLGVLAACDGSDGSEGEQDGPKAGAAAAQAGSGSKPVDINGNDVPEQPDQGKPSGRDEDGNGQTGSMGAAECETDADCSKIAEDRLAELHSASSGMPVLRASSCEIANVITDDGSFSGSACTCEIDGVSGGHQLGPAGLGCFDIGRGGTCLWDDSEWDGCDTSDPASCEAMCEELVARIAADEAHVFEVEVLAATCKSNNCYSAVRVDDQCFANLQLWSPVDCALGGDGIVQAAMEGPDEPPQAPTSPDLSPYVDGAEGFIELTASRSFHGTVETSSGFGVFAQFFDAIEGEETRGGTEIDPLEGIDDCGVRRDGGTGTGVDIQWHPIGQGTLIDGDDSYPLEEFMSGSLYSYGVSLEGEPRYGERYEVTVGGGEFGDEATFAIDLPQALAIETFEQRSRFAREALTLHWSGTGAAPLRFQMWITPQLSDFLGDTKIECLVKDDGEFTIPAEVLQAVPEGLVMVDVRRQLREVKTEAGHAVLIQGLVNHTYRFALGEACDGAEVVSACEQAAESIMAAYEACGAPPQSLAELCPDYLAESCVACPEYFACKAERTSCGVLGLSSSGQCLCE